MSVKSQAWAWKIRDLSPTERLVLLALADEANDAGECWPWIKSQDVLAEKCGVSRETVNRSLSSLEKKHFVVRSERKKDLSGRDLGKAYFLVFDPPGVTESHRGCDGKSQGGVTENHTSLYYPVLESPESKEPIKKAGASKIAAPDSRVAEVIRHFSEQCEKPTSEGGRGFKPEINGKRDGAMVKMALVSLDLEECCRCIDFFLKSEKADELGVSLSIALSAHTVNLWREKQGAIDEAFNALANLLDRIEMGEQGATLKHAQARETAFVIGWDRVKELYQRGGPLLLKPEFEKAWLRREGNGKNGTG